MTALAVLVAGVSLVFAPAGADEAPESAITITQTPSGGGGLCTPASLGLTYTTANTPESFTLRVRATAAPCTPIEAKAVVYAMPRDGSLWPQTLVEVVPFTISVAGLTEIVFAKGCDPVQFDVLTGATPQVISPTGEWHGPLLFPFDTATSLQYFGNPDCTPPTTTASTTTTTTPEVDNVTTVPVESSTTLPEVAAATTVPAEGSGISQSPVAAPAQLALTGTGTAWGALGGSALILAGAAMLFMARRREADAS